MELGAGLAVSAGWVIAYLVEDTITGDDVRFSVSTAGKFSPWIAL